MRKLSRIQKRNNLNEVYAVDDKGNGGGNHRYLVTVGEEEVWINFQDGPRNIVESIHGLLDQDLLEIVRDRLSGFAKGELATVETVKALEKVEEALLWLNKRVEDRAERQVLGTNKE